METQKLWIIPGNELEQLEDGEPILYDSSDHQENCKDFCNKYNINSEYCTSHTSYAKLFNSLGMIIVFNSGKRVDGLYHCGIYLPENLTNNQIQFLEDTKELFNENYYQLNGLFETRVYTTAELPYKTTDGFRDLHIESIIENRKNDNGQELLYIEVDRQKDLIKEPKI